MRGLVTDLLQLDEFIIEALVFVVQTPLSRLMESVVQQELLIGPVPLPLGLGRYHGFRATDPRTDKLVDPGLPEYGVGQRFDRGVGVDDRQTTRAAEERHLRFRQ